MELTKILTDKNSGSKLKKKITIYGKTDESRGKGKPAN